MQNNLLQKIFENRKLILAAVLPFSFWIGVFVFWFHSADSSSEEPIIVKSQNKAAISSISQIASDTARIDSDNDGLSDWEESIYGTSAGNADSDGDGYLDGEEVLSGHNPAKKGPDDLLSEKQNNDSTGTARTATDKFSKLAIENYLRAFKDKDPAELSSDEVKEALTTAFNGDGSSQEFNEILKAELYYFIPSNLDKEIKAVNDNSKKSIDKYQLDLVKAVTEIAKNNPDGDFIQAIRQSMQGGGSADIDKFNKYHKESYEKIKNLDVPSSLAAGHKDYAARLYKLWKIGEAVKSYNEDPAKTLLALNELSNFVQTLRKEYAR